MQSLTKICVAALGQSLFREALAVFRRLSKVRLIIQIRGRSLTLLFLPPPPPPAERSRNYKAGAWEYPLYNRRNTDEQARLLEAFLSDCIAREPARRDSWANHSHWVRVIYRWQEGKIAGKSKISQSNHISFIIFNWLTTLLANNYLSLSF